MNLNLNPLRYVEQCCCASDDDGQLVMHRPEGKVQLTPYSHHDQNTAAMMDPFGISAFTKPQRLTPPDSREEEEPEEESAPDFMTQLTPAIAPIINDVEVASTESSEKVRVMAVMKTFASKALVGIEAWTIGAEYGEIVPIRYSLTSDLGQLRLESSGKPTLSCNITSFTGFCRGREGLQHLLRSASGESLDKLHQMLGSDIIKRLVVLQCHDRALSIVEASEQLADQLVTAVWVLRSYNQQKAKGALEVSRSKAPPADDQNEIWDL